jgi:hypothetical protein
MSTPHKQFRRRLARLEVSLRTRSQCTETPLFVRVRLEAQQELPRKSLYFFKARRRRGEKGAFIR